MTKTLERSDLEALAKQTLAMADALFEWREAHPEISREEFMRSFRREQILRTQHDELLVEIVLLEGGGDAREAIEAIQKATERMEKAANDIKEKKEDIKVAASVLLFLAAVVSGDVKQIVSTGRALVASGRET